MRIFRSGIRLLFSFSIRSWCCSFICYSNRISYCSWPGGTGVSESPAPTCKSGNKGSNSIFSTITSTGGGGGVKQGSTAPANPTTPGGSGGGGSYNCGPAGAGNDPAVVPSQGPLVALE